MSSSRIRIKMCGMTRSEDIAHACSLGVDAVGLIFHPKSPRYVTLDQAQKLLGTLPPFIDSVAVLVNPEKAFVMDLIKTLPIQLLQFHGNETEVFCQQFNKPYIKAIHAHTANDIQHAMQEFSKSSAILLDTPSDTVRGGTGLRFDWTIIPKNMSKACILSGGLNAANVIEAVEACSPYAVDVCSGIEAAHGVKDHSKMSQFVEALWGK